MVRNKGRLLKIAMYGLVLGTIAFGYGQACSDSQLTRMRPGINIASKSSFCLSPPMDRSVYTKFLFVVDKSGSNVSGNGGPPTDPNNIYRAQNIRNFFNEVAADPNQAPYVRWGLVVFQDNGARSLVSSGFTGDATVFSQALDKLKSDPDDGGTPYKPALQIATQTILDDLNKTKTTEANSTYMVVFLSDGVPTPERKVTQEILDAVASLISASPNRIRLSTGYYGPKNTEAAAGLRSMADTGRGKFIDINETGGRFDIRSLIVGGKSLEPFTLRHLLVYNLNSAICFDKKYGMDSDGDGLCDVDEIELKKQNRGPYDPTNRYSFADGFNDSIHYAASLAGTRLPECDLTQPDAKEDKDFDLLNRCEEKFVYNAAAQTTLGRIDADFENPDSDYDGIVDGIEYLALRDKSSPLNPRNLEEDKDFDNLNAYFEIGYHRNPLVADGNLKPQDTYDTVKEYLGTDALGRNCYSFSQKYLKTYPTLPVSGSRTLPYLGHGAGENMILVYYMQSPEGDTDTLYYMHSVQKLKNVGGTTGLQLGDPYMIEYKMPLPTSRGF